MNCPECNNDLLLKQKEAYKEFWICATRDCPIVSVIVTTTIKETDEDE